MPADQLTEELSRLPGFLVRRLHQINQALFAELVAGTGVTSVQLSVLTVIGAKSGQDQSEVAEAVGADRATMASVVARLEAAALLKRSISRQDRRQKLLALTPKGRRVVEKAWPALRATQETLLAPLSTDEQAQFLALLTQLVDEGNNHGRARLKRD
ncbi:MarR family winged helix-turn-helix transcriptional regulator [Acidocella sp.]|uniref:MarR family winged helix-turn-helix transcriptional regulator n=1 Tax=Acidocella sp. TaxID=50710 RepID=UPI002633E071|nr:MarR family winged helix-turn-helix transcriptional regulator [Acidocella sp.]